MNSLQKKELNLLRCFIEVCEKLNLNYFLVCGSALGAMRHGGFIPWDDDMDVGMYREDYNKFMELAPALLPEGIFLQNYKTDPAFPSVFAKLRDSNTTYIEKSAKELNINHGIYIDIFPLDGCPSGSIEQKKLAFFKKYYLFLLGCSFTLPETIKGKVMFSTLRLFGVHKRRTKILTKYEALISKCSVNESDIICNHGTWYGKRDYISKHFYGKGSDAYYEGVKVRVPEKCIDYLVALYGAWQVPPPPEKQKGHHYYEICDTEKPFTYYINNGLKVENK
jgi:lipopolysaccharide cholinephosphotransferase